MSYVDEAYAEADFHVNKLYADGRLLTTNVPVVGREWFLNAATGAATHDGKSFSNSKLTMADIFDELASGDVVWTIGKIREELTCPVGIFGVKIIGASSTRHPDAHTGNNGYVASGWTPPASPTATTPLCIVKQQGWEFHNILFDAPVDAAAIRLDRDGGADDAERDEHRLAELGVLNKELDHLDHASEDLAKHLHHGDHDLHRARDRGFDDLAVGFDP